MGSHLDPDYITGANWDQLGDTLFLSVGVFLWSSLYWLFPSCSPGPSFPRW